MADENQFLLYATLMGVYITFFYDILRIFRRVIPHANFMVSLEDIGFWIYCSIKVFMLMYYESDGTLRWFAVLGALLGMTVYRKLVSPFFVKYLSLGLKWVLGILVKSGKFLFRGGPLMSTYYATKSYVTSFTLAISEELRRNKSNVKIGVLCPGPVKTNFNNVAGVKFTVSSLSSGYVAKYAIDKFLRSGKTVIVPGFSVRMGLFFSRFLSIKSLLRVTYKLQRRKR